jgi:hypothetical protein
MMILFVKDKGRTYVNPPRSPLSSLTLLRRMENDAAGTCLSSHFL